VEIKLLTSTLPDEKIELLKKLGIEVRFIDRIIYPFIMVADGRNGISIETFDEKKIKGKWFLNQRGVFERKFEELWEEAGEIK
jgi:hypothetical protein